MTRRMFVAATAACALCGGCAATGTGGGGGGSAAAGPLTTGRPASTVGPVDAGPLSAYSRDGAYGDFADDGFLIVRHGGRLTALSSQCTHKAATLRVKGGAIVCPRHGARFSPDGMPTKPPARVPLPRLQIALNPQGHVVVDTSRQSGPDGGDKPGYYVDATGT